jgi:peptidoglycan/xylan/chitin deacetylase (PgdA/CDA1 family)
MQTPPPPLVRSRLRGRGHPHAIGFAIATALALVAAAGAVTPAQAATPPQTVVTFTFDDANADQMAANTILKNHGMHGTYFINSGSVNQDGYLTKANLDTLKADGNEIGGHTVSHPDLATLSTAEAKAQICLDRNNLLGWGYAVTDFAYPFASVTPALEALVKDCGYNSARGLGDLKSDFGCPDCDYAESTSPADPYLTKALDEVDDTWTLAQLEGSVTNAEAAGGWVQFTIHDLCATSCTAAQNLGLTASEFTDFLDWLQPRSGGTTNTVVKTVAQVIGGAQQAAVPATVPWTAPADGSGISNSSFETLANGAPACWQEAGYGDGTATYSTVTPGHTGAVAAQLTVTGETTGDAKVLPTLDLGTCSPPVTAGKTYALSAWYTSTVNTQFEIYLRNAQGAWYYWNASPTVLPTTTFTRLTYVTPAVPAGSTAISFGFNLATNGTVVSDDFALGDESQVPVTTATAAPAAANGTGGWYTTAPAVTLANDVKAQTTTIQYSFNGGSTWTTYTAPIAVPTGSSTLSYRSTTATKTEATKTLAFKVDTDKPVVSATYSSSARTIAVSATDATSGVAAIQQSVNGAAWTAYAGNGAAGDAARTIAYRAIDVAGNVSDSASLTIPAAAGVTPPVVTPPVVTPPVVTPPVVKPPVVAAPTVASVTVSATKSAHYGSKHTATIAVAAGTAAPTGKVTLKVDGKAIHTATLAAGKAKVSLPTTLKVGKHSLVATYSGNATTASGSSTATTVTVTKASASVSVTLSKKSVVAHHTAGTATVVASVKASSLKPTGKITVYVDGKAVKSSSLTAGKHGRVVITLPHFATTGSHSIRARLSGSTQVTTTTSTAHRITVTAR